MKINLPLETFSLKVAEGVIEWPANIPETVYTMIYSHSQLQIAKRKPILKENTLYEAWAFDGQKSWHIWKRLNEWVCTYFDTSHDDPTLGIVRGQLLANHFRKSLDKTKLVIYERISFDEDNQAHIAYACPIDFQ